MLELPQRRAVLQLLGDDDPVTVALVKEQLLERGEGELDGLRDLLAWNWSVAPERTGMAA